MRTGRLQRNKSAPRPVGRRRTGPRLILAALVAVLSLALAGPALAAGPPSVETKIPSFATHLGGTSVTIIGENFTGATAVRFGETNAASFTVNSNTLITAVSPPGGEGTSVHLTVTTPQGTSQSYNEFHYLTSCQEGHAPAITSVEPNSGRAGRSVTIRGERFDTTLCGELFSVVRFNGSVHFGLTGGYPAKSGTNECCEIIATAPPGTGTVDVTVENGLGQSPVTPSDQFTYAPLATYHWYRGGVKLSEGTVVPIVMFGGKTNLSQNNLLGEPNCKTVLGGTIENPVGGGAGVGRTNSMASYECKAPQCEAAVLAKFGVEGRFRITTQNNPAATQEPAFPGWSDSLEESTVEGVVSVQEKIGEPWEAFKTPSPPGMIRETQICEVAPTKEVFTQATVEGELKPEIGVAKSGNLNGTTSAKPSTIKFSAASTGAMHSEEAGETTDNGSIKYLGYNEQELITVKP